MQIEIFFLQKMLHILHTQKCVSLSGGGGGGAIMEMQDIKWKRIKNYKEESLDALC